MTTETTPAGTITYAYDAAGRRTSMSAYGQTPVTHGYDSIDRLTSLSQGSLAVTFSYDDAGRLVSQSLPNSVAATYTHTSAGQVASVGYARLGTPIGDLTYTYDAAGRRTAAGGTLAQAALPDALSSASYNAANRLTSWGGSSLSYDANGNLSSEGTRSYVWNARGQLVQVNADPQTVLATFAYDPFGRRRTATVSGTATGFTFDGMNPVTESVSGVTTSLLSGGVDQFYARTAGAVTQTFLSDGLGSTMGLVDASGAITTSYAYAPFGATTQMGAPSTNRYQFTGRENDGTGLYYYRARYYHPVYGRFISEDPIGFMSGDTNPYSYAWNSPTNLTDPSGQCPICFWALGGMAAYTVGTCLSSWLSGRKDPCHGWNLADLGIAGAMGAFSGFFGPYLVGWGARFLVNATIGAVGGVWSAAASGPTNASTFAAEVLTSTVGGGVGGAFGEGVGQGFLKGLATDAVIEAVEDLITDFLTRLLGGGQSNGPTAPGVPTWSAPNAWMTTISLRSGPLDLFVGHSR